ncbi:glutaredoxin [Plakobranchus ocellatus]|uniref:Glutaredoxin n=1 Tax=Plakobranchus ocellatus TaxID=259542 RepID=A0AAV4BIE0_9GAST|nr:glutaredoxin [Plakobranchus ocellatus]
MFSFQCEPDECYLLIEQLKKDNIVRTHGGLLKSQKNAFSGKEFLAWVVEKQGLDKERGIEMGQTLLDHKFASPPKAGELFKGGDEIYVLTEEIGPDALNAGGVSDCTPKTATEIGELLRKMILKLYGVFLSDDGKSVDYKGMKASEEFKTYTRMTRELTRVELTNATREEKLAFFINIYNALVIHASVERGPPTSLWGRYRFFNGTKYIIGGHPYSLQDIENGVLRANRKGVGYSYPCLGDNSAERDGTNVSILPILTLYLALFLFPNVPVTAAASKLPISACVWADIHLNVPLPTL